MALYKVEVDKQDNTLTIDCSSDLELAKSVANNYNKKGYDVYIKEVRTIYLRKSIKYED